MPGYACSEANVDQIADNLHLQEVMSVFNYLLWFVASIFVLKIHFKTEV